MTNIIKLCKICQLHKPVEDFRKNSKSKDGLKSYCIICDDEKSRENYLKNREKRLKGAAEWNAANPEKVKEYKSKYYGEGRTDF